MVWRVLKPAVVTQPRPDVIVDHFLAIDFERLGRSYLILDVDNTIAPCGAGADMVDGVAEHLDRARASGALQDVCLVSNVFAGRAKRRRVERFAQRLRAHCVMPGIFQLKPHPAPFLEALGRMGATAMQTVVVGDQMFTDVLGGNRLQMLTVYVHPLGPDHWTTWLTMRRVRERRLLRAWTSA